jgi:serine/threonine protein kinase
VIGSGAFGIVFAATALSSGRTVAVKFLQSGALADDHERQALFNEVSAAREVRHPHVLNMLFANVTSDDYPPYTVSEYADGGTLLTKLDEAYIRFVGSAMVGHPV